jgi:hypothetical protein
LERPGRIAAAFAQDGGKRTPFFGGAVAGIGATPRQSICC